MCILGSCSKKQKKSSRGMSAPSCSVSSAELSGTQGIWQSPESVGSISGSETLFPNNDDMPEFKEWNEVWKDKYLASGRLLIFEECWGFRLFPAGITSAGDMSVLEMVVEVVSVSVLCVFGILSGNSLMNGLVDGGGDDEEVLAFHRET